MRIVYPIVKANTGSDVYFKLLASAMQKRGIETEIVFSSKYRELLPLLSSSNGSTAIRKADLIHTNLEYSPWMTGYGKPVISTFHHNVFDPEYRKYVTAFQKLHHALQIRPRIQKGLKISNAIVSVSHATQKSLEKTFRVSQLNGAGKSVAIVNAVDCELFRPPEQPVERKKRILVVGSVSVRKGADFLSVLLPLLPEDVELAWVTKTGKNLEGVNILVDVSHEELQILYQESLAVLSLSRLEGFGYSIVEGMACSTPVIAFDHSSFTEIIDHDECGYLCSCYDLECIAGYIRQLVENPQLADKLGQNGRKKVQELYSLDRMLDDYEQLYLQVYEEAKSQG